MRSLERTGAARPRARVPARAEARSARRIERQEGLTAPELSVLLAYTKIVLAEELLDTDLPDDPFLRSRAVLLLPDADAPGLPRARWSSTRCAARSSSPRWSTSWSTSPASRSSTGSAGRPRRRRPRAGPGQLRGPRDLRRRPAASADRRASTTSIDAAVQTHMRLECARWSSARRGGWSTTAGRRSTAEAGRRPLRGRRAEGGRRAARTC